MNLLIRCEDFLFHRYTSNCYKELFPLLIFNYRAPCTACNFVYTIKSNNANRLVPLGRWPSWKKRNKENQRVAMS